MERPGRLSTGLSVRNGLVHNGYRMDIRSELNTPNEIILNGTINLLPICLKIGSLQENDTWDNTNCTNVHKYSYEQHQDAKNNAEL